MRWLNLLLLLALGAANAAEVAHEVVAHESNSTTTSSTYTNPSNKQILGTNLVGNTTYILIVQAQLSGNVTSANDFEFQMYEDGTVAAEITASHARIEPAGAAGANGHNYTFIAQVTTASTPNNYQWRHKSGGTNETATIGWWAAMISLDDLAAADYKYNNSTTSNVDVASGSWTDGASVTIGNGTDDYLIIATSHWIIDGTADDLRHVIDVGGTEYNEVQAEGEDVDEEYAVGSMAFIAAPASSTTAKVKVRTTGASHDNDNTAIFALRLNAFEDYAGTRTTTPTAITVIDTDTVVETLTHTTSTVATEDWMFFAQAINDVGEQVKRTSRELSDSGIGTIVGIKTDKEVIQNGATDLTQTFIFNESLAIANSTSLDTDLILREDDDVTPNPSVVSADIIGFTWELAAASSTIAPIAQQRQQMQ